MKKIALLVTMMALLPWVVSAQSPGDDIYFVPKKQKEEKKTEKVEAKSAGEVLGKAQQVNIGNVGTVIVRDYTGRERDIDEYNRREYVAGKNDFSIENDTLYIDEHPDSDLPGHWVGGEFEGSPDDYEYAVRLIRFQNPAYAIPVSSPLYWDVVYGTALFPSWDWNVYDDGIYAYVFPTFSNPLWWSWRYDPWSSWYWNRWYWGDPYYYAWHRPYWDAPYWGWHHPHHYYPHRPGGYVSYTDSRRGQDFNRHAWRGAASRPSATSGRPSVSSVRSGRVNARALSDRQRSNNVLRSSATGRVVRPSMSGSRVNNGTRGNSSYMRPTTNRPRSLDYRRPSSTRRNNNVERTRSVENRSSSERSSFNRSSFNRSSFNRSNFGGGSRGRVNTGGGGSRSRR